MGATSHGTKQSREGYTMDLEWQTVNDPLHMNNNKTIMVVFPLHLLCTRNCSRSLACSICSLMKVVIPDLHRVTMNENELMIPPCHVQGGCRLPSIGF